MKKRIKIGTPDLAQRVGAVAVAVPHAHQAQWRTGIAECGVLPKGIDADKMAGSVKVRGEPDSNGKESACSALGSLMTARAHT